MEDRELLREYTECQSEAAFTELVSRHINLVYSTAFRVVGESQLAQDVAQSVFIQLARKARSIREGNALPGWLYRATGSIAANAMRSEHRRRARETEAMNRGDLHSNPSDAWEAIAPLLEEAMQQLNQTEQDAILLRFFEGKNLREAGATLGLTENAMQKRVSHAIERLREFFAKRGVTVGAGGLVVLSTNAIHAAPAGLVTAITSASLVGAATGGGTVLTLLKTTVTTKLKVGIVSALAIASVAIPLVIHHQTRTRLREEGESLQQQADQLARLKAANERLSGLVADNSPAADRLNELQRLRREAGALRAQTNGLVTLAAEHRRLQAAVAPRIAWQTKEETKAKMAFARECLMALRFYADDNNDQLPAEFEAVSRFLPVKTGTKTNLTTGLFEIVSQGPLSKIKNPEKTIVIRERQPVQTPDGNWIKTYGFADGHTETHTEAGNSFDAWEAQRMASLTPSGQ